MVEDHIILSRLFHALPVTKSYGISLEYSVNLFPSPCCGETIFRAPNLSFHVPPLLGFEGFCDRPAFLLYCRRPLSPSAPAPMAVSFSDLHTEAGLKTLEEFLAGKTYISGWIPTFHPLLRFFANSFSSMGSIIRSVSLFLPSIAGVDAAKILSSGDLDPLNLFG